MSSSVGPECVAAFCGEPSVEIFVTDFRREFTYCEKHKAWGHRAFTYVGPYDATEEEWA